MTAPLPRRIAWFAPWRWKRRWWIAACVLMLTGYPLSIGPAIWLTMKGLMPAYLYNAIYMPIGIIVRFCPPAADWLMWYVEWFVAIN